MIIVGFGIEAVFLISLAAVGDCTVLGLALVAIGSSFGSVGGRASQAMVVDLVPPERHERAYAALRVGNNLGVTLGPPLSTRQRPGWCWRCCSWAGRSSFSRSARASRSRRC